MFIHKFKIWGVFAAVLMLIGLCGASGPYTDSPEDDSQSSTAVLSEEKTQPVFPEPSINKEAPTVQEPLEEPELKAEETPAVVVPPAKKEEPVVKEDLDVPKVKEESAVYAPSIPEKIADSEKKIETAPSLPPEAAITMDEALKDQVKRLRKERQKQMPYLNKATLREKINAEKLRQRRQFGSGGAKSLDDLLERAVEVHTPALASRERIVLAKRRILSAIRGLAPEANFEYNLKKGTLSTDAYTSQNYKVSLTQPIFHGGILWNTLLQEKAGLEAAQKEYVSTIEDLVSDVTAAYLEYNRAYQVVQYQEKTLKTLKHYVDISKQKYKAQLISEIENLNTESLYSLNQYDHETSKQELELAKLDLQRYLDIGLEAPVETRPLYDLDNFVSDRKESDLGKDDQSFDIDQGNPSADLPELVDLAYQHRAQLQVESSKLDSARLQEKIRLGEFMPKLDLSIDFGKLGESFKAIRLDPGLRQEFRLLVEMTWNIGGNKATWSYENDEKAPSVSQFQTGAGSLTRRNSLQVGVLDGLADWVSVKEAEVAKLDQITQLEKVEKEVIHDVKQSFFDYQKAKIRVKSSIQRYNYRKRLSAYSEHRLGKNEIQVSEYLQAEIDVLTEATTLHKALADYYTAKSKLNHSVGIRNYFPLREFHADTAKS